MRGPGADTRNSTIRVAIVNRGEAAVRALHSLVEASGADGVRYHTIALYTEPDRDAIFVRRADEAFSLGSAMYFDEGEKRAKHAYLDHERLEAALRETRADAVWVGWGFVAEDADFAERCAVLGIVFVGPPVSAMRSLADKIEAKRIAESVGVPVVPWSNGPVDSVDAAMEHAKRIGFPLMVKAAAGGGGRGIREVFDMESLAQMYRDARNEGKTSFGDPTVFLERRAAAARHVEVQVLGDNHGTIWVLGVRECTVQRRRQKILEESGLSIANPEVESRLRKYARDICAAVGYANAGTVEFLYEPASGAIYFMEVNTRLQVEHTVTEMVTGVDLVRYQMHVAFGGRLEGSVPAASGHAIEVRLNAEDPDRDFAPSPGRVTLYRPPNGPGLRVDSGIGEGDRIPSEFDSMVAKIIAWAPNRQEALQRLSRALLQTEIVIEGGATNKSFLLDLVRRPEIKSGEVHTAWLGEVLRDAEQWPRRHASVALAQAAVEAYEEDLRAECEHFLATAARGRPEVDGRDGRLIEMRYRGATYAIGVLKFGPGLYRLTLDDNSSFDLGVDRLGKYERMLRIGGQRYQALSILQGPECLIEVRGETHRVLRNDGGSVRSHCPAVIASVLTKEGDDVKAGTPLFVIESMKMESTVCAPCAGRVKQIVVTRGAQVDSGDVLARIDARGDADAGDSTVRISFRAEGQEKSSRDVFDVIFSMILGYDVDPLHWDGMAAALADVHINDAAPDVLLAAEQRVIGAFCDIHALAPQSPLSSAPEGTRPEDHLLSYLRLPDRAVGSLPESFLDDLRVALKRYGIDDLEPTTELDDALLRISRSRRTVRRQESIIVAILLRWRRCARELLPSFSDYFRDLLDRLTRITDASSPAISDLARAVRLRYFDQFMLDLGREMALKGLDGDLDLLQTALGWDSDPSHFSREIEALIASPEPCQEWLLPWMKRSGRQTWKVTLAMFLRIQYRHLAIETVTQMDDHGAPIFVVSATRAGKALSIVATVGEREELSTLVARVEQTMRTIATNGDVAVEIVCLSNEAEKEMDAPEPSVPALFDRHLRGARYVVVTTVNGGAKRPVGFHTYKNDAGHFHEIEHFRHLHATTAERLELWRLRNFKITTLRTAGNYHLFACSAHENSRDHRLFAYTEVRDISPVANKQGRVEPLLRLELAILKCLDSLRQHIAAEAGQNRYVWNRVAVYVEPVWTRSLDDLKDVAYRIAPYTRGLSLDQVNLRIRLAAAQQPRGWSDVVVNMAMSGSGIQIGVKAISEEPIRYLTDYRAKSAEMKRLGFAYPYDIVRLLTSPGVTHSDYPIGEFREYDLDNQSRLSPVERPYGGNIANLVVGVITNFTPKHPEGMSRVVILNDPSKSLGSLGEAECRRIVAALDLAQERSLPIEWFAVSSGARVAMDSGTENMDWTARVLRRIVEFTQSGHEINVVVTGINVGAQSYWNAEATMLMHSRGILVMVADSAMVLTGKHALDYSGAVSADNNAGIGGYDKIMGGNGEAQYWAADVDAACKLLFRHYELTYVAPGERFPRRSPTTDPATRDIRVQAHTAVEGTDFNLVGDIFDAEKNRDRKRPFDVRAVMQAVADADTLPLERWPRMRDADTAVVWDMHVGGMPVCMVGIESRDLQRSGIAPADGPQRWSAGTLFPKSSKKVARAINAASGNRPVVVLANLSGFDGSPESMRELQLEYGAEIGRAVVNFRGPIVFCVLSRYHGGAFVVFSKTLNDNMTAIAVEGAYASVLGGAPAAAVVFSREVEQRLRSDVRVIELARELARGPESQDSSLSNDITDAIDNIRVEKRGEIAREFDAIHTIDRALAVGSIDEIVSAAELRTYIVESLTRGMAAATSCTRPLPEDIP